MGKREKKSGKGRLDKYYKLAKEQGYRARSAFKLIQLDKKYNFLQNARCVIDLCAAPGGWLQVAAKHMQPSSLIIGIDLVPIKPVANAITIADDITSDSCRSRLRSEMKDWKADVVLHDGAPNVGQAWLQDAFTQAQLVLHSLKLATEFLAPGGTFVSKCFRSKDYNSLLWVFNQLFKRVEATKPPSSRNVSAEIFVVCTGYLAPRKIDPKLLDHHHVFEELDLLPSLDKDNMAETLTPKTNILHPEKKTRKREGYAEGDYTLHHTIPAMEFITSKDPTSALTRVNQISFKNEDDKGLLKHRETTDEIVECLKDLKVLGRKDFKNIIKWRISIRNRLNLEVPKGEREDNEKVEIEEMEDVDEDAQLDAELEKLNDEERRKRKRERRKKNEKRTREVQRQQLKMTAPTDMALDQELGGIMDWNNEDDDEMEFDDEAGSDNGGKARKQDEEQEEQDSDRDTSDEVDELEEDLDRMYDELQNNRLERDAKARARANAKKSENQLAEEEEWQGIQSDAESSSSDENGDEGDLVEKRKSRFEDDSDESDSDDDNASTLPPPTESSTLDKKRKRDDLVKERAASQWFDQAVFKDLGDFGDAFDDDDDDGKNDKKKNKKQQKSSTAAAADNHNSKMSNLKDKDARPTKQQKKEKSVKFADGDDEEEGYEDISDDEKKGNNYTLDTAEAMTLAYQLVNREKSASQLVDEGFNRHSFDDKDGLPNWFLDDEIKHIRSNIPVTKEAVNAIRAKARTLDARPIKKIAEAKARKKMRTLRRMEKMAKKADTINEGEDMTEKEKALSIQKLLAKAKREPKNKKNEIKTVVASGKNRGIKGRPAGVKGRYKMVDARMKKELRANKRKEKAAKSNKKRK